MCSTFGIFFILLFFFRNWQRHAVYIGNTISCVDFVEIKSKYCVWELLADFGIYFGFMYPKPDSESTKTNLTFVKQTRMHGLNLVQTNSAEEKNLMGTFRIFAMHVISMLDLGLITLFTFFSAWNPIDVACLSYMRWIIASK